MFEQAGFGADDLADIRRHQFTYYIQLAGGLSDLSNWLRLRRELLAALTAAFALDFPANTSGLTMPQRRARALLDKIRARHDPAEGWTAFVAALWEGRSRIRGDL